MRYYKFFLSIGLIFTLFACNNTEQRKIDKKQYDLDNVNIAQVNLYADHHAKYLLEQLGIVYTAHFTKASIQPKYRKDAEVMNAIFKDSTRLIVLMRECTENEMLQIQKMHEAKPLQYTFAYDAITLVKEKSFEDSVISITQFDHYIQNSSDHFVVVKDHLDLFQHLLSKNGVKEGNRGIKVVQNTEELKRYLSLNKDNIGILPFSLVSQRNDEYSKRIKADFKFLGIQTDSSVIYPSQSSIYTKEWPLILPYTILYCNLSTEDGVGFVKFIHNRQSSKLILKSGLVPFILPQRDILIENQSFTL